MGRVISWFSCGAASAVATVLAAIKYGDRMEAVYCRVEQEHSDNLRFLHDFENTFDIPVKIIRDEEHQGSIYSVFLKRGFIKNQYGAPCTMILKKDMRKAYQRPDDIQVFGYTSEEQDRIDRFIDANNDVQDDFILMSNGVTKQDCYRYVHQWGSNFPQCIKWDIPITTALVVSKVEWVTGTRYARTFRKPLTRWQSWNGWLAFQSTKTKREWCI